jgi:hypothetical protein
VKRGPSRPAPGLDRVPLQRGRGQRGRRRLDRQGNPVEGLTQADFTVKEDGRPQTVSAFEAVDFSESPATAPPGRQRISTNATAPVRGDRSFVIVFDDANISSYASPRARKAIIDFLDRGLRGGDQVMIAPTSGGPWWAGRMPEDHDTLVSFVEQLQGAWRPDTTAARIWDHEAIAIANGRNRQLEAEVARRYFENNLIPEAYPQDRELAAEINVSPGVAMIRTKAQQVYREAVTRLRATLDTLARVSTVHGAAPRPQDPPSRLRGVHHGPVGERVPRADPGRAQCQRRRLLRRRPWPDGVRRPAGNGGRGSGVRTCGRRAGHDDGARIRRVGRRGIALGRARYGRGRDRGHQPGRRHGQGRANARVLPARVYLRQHEP